MSARSATTESPRSPVSLQTAVLFLVFNRPDTTARAFESIRGAKPLRLYVAADGPRENRAAEAERVRTVREYVLSNVDWCCEVKTLFREENLGCKYAVSGALTWFFGHEMRGIILEDDCVAHPDFFPFCEALLERYANDGRVSVITGNNFQDGQKRGDAAYYFSRYNHCWGWASWRRAWSLYCGDLAFWPEWKRSSDWRERIPDPVERRYWGAIFDRVHAGAVDSWAYPWTGSLWYKGGLTATPNSNLVSNIGFGPDASHTRWRKSELDQRPVQPLGELFHPAVVEQDRAADRYVFDRVLGGYRRRFPRSLVYAPRRSIGWLYRKLDGLLPDRIWTW